MALQTKDFSASVDYNGNTMTYILRVTENSVNTENNTSNLTIKAILKQAWSGELFWQYGTTVTCTINGTQIFSDYARRNLNGTSEHTYYTWTGDVAHAADGTLNLKVGGKIWQTYPDYFPSNGITIVESDSNILTLIKITREFTLSFNANGGAVSTTNKTVTYGSTYGTLPTPTRTGYTFTGWYTAASGGTRKQAGDTYNTASNSTLYAQWTINKYYFDLNGVLDGKNVSNINGYGTCDIYINGSLVANDVADYYAQHNYNSTYEIKDIKTADGRTYNGIGWGKLTGTITADTGVGLSFTTLTYTVTYDANGGVNAPAAQTKTHGITLTLSDQKPTKEGYNFLGWATSSSATSAEYGVKGNYVNNNNITLYAVWTQNAIIQRIFAKYQMPDGSYTEYAEVYAGSHTAGTTISWALEESDEYHAASISFITDSAAKEEYITVYRKQYSINYNANGGRFAPKPQLFYYDSDLYLINKRPTRSGYKFLGWSYDENAIYATYTMNDPFPSKITSGPTLYAVWEKSAYDCLVEREGRLKGFEIIEI